MDWSSKTLHYFDLLTRHIFLPMLSVDQWKGVNSDKLLEVLHRMMNLNQVMCGKTEVILGKTHRWVAKLFDLTLQFTSAKVRETTLRTLTCSIGLHFFHFYSRDIIFYVCLHGYLIPLLTFIFRARHNFNFS